MDSKTVIRKSLLKTLLLQYQLLLLCILQRRRLRLGEKRKHRFWMRKLFKDQEDKSLFTVLVRDLQLFDQEYFFKNFRMNTASFEELLSWVKRLGLVEEKLCDYCFVVAAVAVDDAAILNF